IFVQPDIRASCSGAAASARPATVAHGWCLLETRGTAPCAGTRLLLLSETKHANSIPTGPDHDSERPAPRTAAAPADAARRPAAARTGIARTPVSGSRAVAPERQDR